MMNNIRSREAGVVFMPKFGSDGLITGVVQSHQTGEVLMVAHMNQEAIAATVDTGLATFWSRSRKELWQKGESSGNTLAVHEIRVDCDQDVLLLIVDAAGPACHTGRQSCFYRRLQNGKLTFLID